MGANVVGDHTCLSEIDWGNGFVIYIVLIATPIYGLASMSAVVEKQAVVRSSVVYKPMHCSDHVRPRWSGDRMHLIIGKNHHIIIRKPVSVQESPDI